MELTGATADEYWADSIAVSIEAYEHLGMDGLITIFVPRNQSDYRCVDNISYSKADIGMSLEQAVAEIDAMPTPEKTEIFKNVRKP